MVRHVCRDSLRTLGVTSSCVGDIELAVTEACTNVLDHVAATQEEYEVAVHVNEATCRIRVIDNGGEGFDHAGHGLGNVEPDAESGRGIFIMRAMVDELHFTEEPEVGASVQLVKRLDLEPDSVLRRLAVST